MDTNITVEPLPQLGVCNLCLGDGSVKSMLTHQSSSETEELYSDMLLKCFGIDVLAMDFGDTKQVICEMCIQKLKDSVVFKAMAQASLRTLEVAAQKVKKEEHSVEFNDNSLDADDDFDCEDNEAQHVNEAPLDGKRESRSMNGVIANIIKKELDPEVMRSKNRATKRKKCKTKDGRGAVHIIREVPDGKLLTADDYLSMLERGLFPFKIGKMGYSCFICPEKTECLDTLKFHVLEHSEKYIQVAFKKSVFNSRCRFSYMTNLNFTCKLCAAEVCNYDELKDHLTVCNDSDKVWRHNLPFKLKKDQLDCPVCEKTFLNFVNLNTHMNCHYPNFVCESCGKAFASQSRLRAHMRTHEVGEFPCKICGAVFDKVTKRENHVSKEHKAGVRYTCRKCNLSLTSFYAKQKHLADVHNEDLRKYKCKACTQSYVTPGHLSSHVRRDHLNERNYKCDKCDLAFYTRNSLKMHMIKHDGERIFCCTICQKAYQRKKTLKEHMRIHNNDKRFVCPFCGRAFTQKCTLKGHLRVHTRKPELELDRKMSTEMQAL